MSGLPLAGAILLVVSELSVLIPRCKAARGTLRTTAVLACLVAVVCAFLSGYQASSRAGELHGTVEEAMAYHHSLGRFLLINSILLTTFFLLSQVAVHGRKVLTALYYLTVCIQIALTVWVGYLGGRLVFEHGVNVAKQAIQP